MRYGSKSPVVSANRSYRKDAGNPRRDKKRFSRTAGMTHKLNTRATPMRGGYRL